MESEANTSVWYDLLTQAYHKAKTIRALAEILGVPKLTVRTWLRRPTGGARGAEKLLPRLEEYLRTHFVSGPNASTRQRMWQSMRCLRIFTIENVMATANSGKSTTQKYVKLLAHAGYVAGASKKSHSNVYQLIRDTGPRAPKVGRERGFVYDCNTSKMVWEKEQAA